MDSARHDARSGTTSILAARRFATRGQWLIIIGFIPLVAWVTLAPLSMAVVAPAFVNVDLNRRPVQHLEGGIVRSVLVRNGQHVNAGDPVLLLGDVSVDADRNRLDYRIYVERASLARLEAEQTMAAQPVFPDELTDAGLRDERIAQALAKERTLFNARRDAMRSEIALLRLQRERAGAEAIALRAQIRQVVKSLALQEKDLDMNRGLLQAGFISPNRISQIEANVTDYAAKLEERRSELARNAQRLGEIDLKIKSIENQYIQTASDQLKEVAARLGEIEQERRKSEDAAQRQVVTAPAVGVIIDLKYTSPGAIVRAGDAIAEIVPTDAALLLEARISPQEVNHVYQGQPARIKLTSFKFRTAPMLTGNVNYLSADRLVDRATNLPYFSVMIEVDAKSVEAVRDLTLQAGMPAEVYLEGSTQTPLQYLLDPVMSTIRRAGKEM